MSAPEILESGELPFSVEARLLREIGERLVRRPETAMTELIKNSYDADAGECRVILTQDSLIVTDDGLGMTLGDFRSAWMTIGTSSRQDTPESRRFQRPITGEKGIGRFSVRFLGEHLDLESVADDTTLGCRTRLSAQFNWPAFDASEGLGDVQVPYSLTKAGESDPLGTTLTISRLRPGTRSFRLRDVRTASLGLVSPLRGLLSSSPRGGNAVDPGFSLSIGDDADENDISALVLSAFVLRADLQVRKGALSLEIYEPHLSEPTLRVQDSVPARYGDMKADIRFFPRRSGVFRGLGLDGRQAYSWVRENSGVAIFDRAFRVSPYGEPGDDWLGLARDAARNTRHPQSAMAMKHFPMTEGEQRSTAENWMLRLPQSLQLVGVVEVAGTRNVVQGSGEGLIAAADREGFVSSDAFDELLDHVRGSIEAIAMVDRLVQRREEELAASARLANLKDEAERAAREVRENKNIPAAEKARIVQAIGDIAATASTLEAESRQRMKQLETMSLLGVVAGFMTHEFGVAIEELAIARRIVEQAAQGLPGAEIDFARLDVAQQRLDEFVDYATGYVRGSKRTPESPFKIAPRIRHSVQRFRPYAEERGVVIEVLVDPSLHGPLVPTSLYDGIALNLFTNALKSVTSAREGDHEKKISFRAWNDKGHHFLEVLDTGIGVPTVLFERVFDPLFTTTASADDPLGSGMGLGLALVRASVQAFNGSVVMKEPPPGFSACVRVQLPYSNLEDKRD